mgnify:CR=1 FL=1
MHFYILPCLFLIFPINLAQANMGIPGPMILFGSYFTMNPIQWVCVCMLMCIFVEGKNRYTKLLRNEQTNINPFSDSSTSADHL